MSVQEVVEEVNRSVLRHAATRKQREATSNRELRKLLKTTVAKSVMDSPVNDIDDAPEAGYAIGLVDNLTTVNDPKAEMELKTEISVENANQEFAEFDTNGNLVGDIAVDNERDRDIKRSLSEQADQWLNESAANIRWKGESKEQRNAYADNRKRDNGVDCFDIAVEGPEVLVFKQENASGKLVRLWLSKDENVSARVRYVNTPSHPISWRLEVYVNKRTDGRWQGKRIAEHHVKRTVTDESELTVAKWVSVWFARIAAL